MILVCERSFKEISSVTCETIGLVRNNIPRHKSSHWQNSPLDGVLQSKFLNCKTPIACKMLGFEKFKILENKTFPIIKGLEQIDKTPHQMAYFNAKFIDLIEKFS